MSASEPSILVNRVLGLGSQDPPTREQLEEIYRRIDALTPIDIETVSYRPTRPLYHWPLGAAVVLILLYHLIMGARQVFRSIGARYA